MQGKPGRKGRYAAGRMLRQHNDAAIEEQVQEGEAVIEDLEKTAEELEMISRDKDEKKSRLEASIGQVDREGGNMNLIVNWTEQSLALITRQVNVAVSRGSLESCPR